MDIEMNTSKYLTRVPEERVKKMEECQYLKR